MISSNFEDVRINLQYLVQLFHQLFCNLIFVLHLLLEKEYNLELIDNYLLDKDPQELSKNAAEIVMAAELIDNYLLDKRFMRELEDRDEYDAA